MTEMQEELEQERINMRDKLKACEECIETIKDLLPREKDKLSKRDLEGLVEEIKFLVEEINNEFF
jgi:hypothetical protein